MVRPRNMTITQALSEIQNHRLTARHLVESCLESIAAHDNQIHAWVCVHAEEALELADTYDGAFRKGQWMGELHGIPIGVKDIIHVQGMWTRAGCDVYPAEIANEDAEVIRRLKSAGAIILGKTATTAFANNDPTITCNPWNIGHTPGGSSSGSGAVVAGRMCPAALGSQTGGSLIRPASYNGVVGFKPTYGQVSLDGVIPVSRSLDHIGSHTRCVEDALRLFNVMREKRPNPLIQMPRPATRRQAFRPGRMPRLGFFRGGVENDISPEMHDHLQVVRECFEAAGATVIDLALPESFKDIHAAHRILFEADLAGYHRQFYEAKADHYPPNLKARIENGMKIPGYQYADALQIRKTFQDAMSGLLSTVDAGLTYASLSTAPPGLGSTGSAAANVPWSFSGFPALSLPSGLDAKGLPFGIQLVGPAWSDESTAAVAMWCEKTLGFDSAPELS